jgi:hypothetical protein
MSDYIVSFDPAVINMSYCTVNVHTLKIYAWNHFSIKDSTNELSCEKLATKLAELSLTSELTNATIVVEKQPKINTKTVLISGQIQMFYTIKKQSEPKTIVKIDSLHAKEKLKVYVPRPGDAPIPERIGRLKPGHYRNKQLAIEHCKLVMKHNNEDKHWVDFFEKHGKSDDADCYLQAMSYIHSHKLRAK